MAVKKFYVPVLFSLGASLVSMGVMKYMGNNNATTTADPNKAVVMKPVIDPKANQQTMMMPTLVERDPFQPEEEPKTAADLNAIKNAQPPKSITKTHEERNFGPLQPLPINGLPPANMQKGTTNLNSANQMTSPKEPLPTFVLTGVVEGSQPVALIRDSHGNQRIARANETLDGDFKVKSVSRQGVIITRGNKSYTLRLGGAAGEKK